jgi:hypothetical protein
LGRGMSLRTLGRLQNRCQSRFAEV